MLYLFVYCSRDIIAGFEHDGVPPLDYLLSDGRSIPPNLEAIMQPRRTPIVKQKPCSSSTAQSSRVRCRRTAIFDESFFLTIVEAFFSFIKAGGTRNRTKNK